MNSITKPKNLELEFNAAIKAEFPVLSQKFKGKDLVYLDSAATTQKPLCVIERMDRYLREENSTVRRGLYTLSAKSTKAFDDVRLKVQKFINAASSDEIIFTRGTTEAINLMATCFERSILSPGDEILISGLEHHANIVPWQLAASSINPANRQDLVHKTACVDAKQSQLAQVSVKTIPILDNGGLDLEAFKTLISSSKVKILALTQIANVTGTIIPAKEMIAIAHQHGVPVLVDGAQAIQHLKIDVQDLDADFYAFSGHKLYGPTGVGVLYMKRAWGEKLSPYHGGGEMIETVSIENGTRFAAMPYKFEAGTPPIVEVIGLGAALNFIEELGVANITKHETELAEYALSQLKQIKGLNIVSETLSGDFVAEKKASLISFTIDDIEVFDLATLINEHAVAIRVGHHCAQPVMKRFGVVATARLSIGLYNSKSDIDAFITALKETIRILKS